MKTIPNHIIAACAGSGKTHQLIQRLLTLLRAGIAPGEILAITFTRKATQEIRQRLLQALQQQAADGEAWAQEVYHRILLSPTPRDMLNIQTFHGWFATLLESGGRDGKQLGAAPVSENDSVFLEAAWRRCLSAAAADEQIAYLLTQISPHGLNEFLTATVAGQINAWQLYAASRPAAAAPEWTTLRQKENKAQQVLLRRARQFQTAMGESTLSADEATATAYFFTQSGTLRKGIIKQAEKHSAEAEVLLRKTENAFARLLLRQAAVFDGAAKLLAQRFADALRQVKTQNNVMSFDDLEYQVNAAVSAAGVTDAGGENNEWLLRLHRRYKHILIDEFQDTSPLQWHIIKRWLLAAHGEGAPGVFIVGDEKQAIYRFRHGDSRLLAVAGNFLRQYYQAKSETHNICRRCAPAVLQFVNTVFGGWYGGFETHESQAGVNAELPGCVQWHIIGEDKEADKKETPAVRNPMRTPPPADSGRERWADAVAEKIRGIIGHWQIDNGGTPRRCRPEDVLVLMPQMTHIDFLTQAFGRCGIAYRVHSGGNKFLNALACRDILALLRVLLSPANTRSLAQVLRSPLFSLSSDELNRLTPAKELWQKLMDSDTEAARQLKKWMGWMNTRNLPVHDLLTEIYADGDVLTRYRRAVPPAQCGSVVADLNALLEFALLCDSGKKPLPKAFLQEAEAAAADKSGSVLATGGGGVQVMTVHKAKGLEAPVVVIADTSFGKKFTAKDKNAVTMLVDWQPDAPAPANIYFARQTQIVGRAAAFKEAEKTLDERELDNLFYVAMTRAQQALIIFSNRNTLRESRVAKMQEAVAAQLSDGELFLGDDLTADASTPPADTADTDTAKIPATAEATTETIGARVDNIHRRRGNEVHQLIGLLLADLDETAIRQIVPVCDAQSQQIARRLVNSDALKNALADCLRFWIEPEFAHNGKIFRMDLVIEKDDSVWVVDHKTGTPEGLAAYRTQMENYRTIIAQCHPGKAITAAFLTRTGELKTL